MNKNLKKLLAGTVVIAGTDDDFVPVEMTYENYKACAAEKRLLIVPGAGHGMSYILDKEEYEKTVLEFWKDFDGKINENQEADGCELKHSAVVRIMWYLWIKAAKQ